MNTDEPLPPFLSQPSRIGSEISITGKWVPTKKGGLFRRSAESREMVKEWEDIHASARASAGVLSTEINHAVGDDAVLVHHVFADADALVGYFSTTASSHMAALTRVASPELVVERGLTLVGWAHLLLARQLAVRPGADGSLEQPTDPTRPFAVAERFLERRSGTRPDPIEAEALGVPKVVCGYSPRD